ncbi:unnamed protein product, partial [Citrullus colocynthis]
CQGGDLRCCLCPGYLPCVQLSRVRTYGAVLRSTQSTLRPKELLCILKECFASKKAFRGFLEEIPGFQRVLYCCFLNSRGWGRTGKLVFL